MAEDFMGMKLQLTLPTDTEIQGQIDKLQKMVDKHQVNVKFNLSDDALKGLEQLAKQSKKQSEDVKNKWTEVLTPLNKLKNLQIEIIDGEAVKRVGILHDGLGRTLEVTQKLNKKTGEWVESTRQVSRINKDTVRNLEHDLKKFQLTFDSKLTKFGHNKMGLFDARELENFRTQLNNLKINPQLPKQMQLLNAEFSKFEADTIAKGLNNANKHAMSLGESLKLVAFKMTTWLVMGDLFFGAINQFQQAVQYIRDLDTAMVDLQKVTNETSQTYAEFQEQAGEVARGLARTSVEVVKATANWAKMGYSLQEAKELASTSLMMQNVGDIQNVDQATTHLIATLKGFNIQAEDSMKVLDLMNEVSNNHAITVDGLGKAYERSAAVMAQAGNTIEQATALYTAANSAIQNPTKVSNGFKTIALRLKGIAEEGDLVFPKLEKQLNDVGIKLRDDVTGEFRATYDVLRDLSKVYKDLDPMTSAKLLEDIAGKYQANVLQSTLVNFADAEAALSDALNSAGSAARENDKYLQSVEARFKAVQVQAEELYSTLLSSDMVKGFLVVTEGLIAGITKVTDIFGALPTIITASVVAMSLFSTKMRMGMLSALGLVTTTKTGFAATIPIITTLNAKIFQMRQQFKMAQMEMTVMGRVGALATLQSAFGVLTGTVKAFTLSTVAARVATTALQATVSLGLSLVFMYALEKIITSLDNFINKEQKAKEAFEDLRSTIKSLQTETAEVDKLISEYRILSEQTVKTTKDKQRLVEIQKRLAEILPETATGINAEGKEIATNIPLMERVLELREQELKLKQDDMSSKFNTQGNSKFSSLQEDHVQFNKLIEDRKKKLKELSNVENKIGLTDAGKQLEKSGISADIDNINKELGELLPNINSTRLELINMANAFNETNKEGNKLSADLVNQLIFSLTSSTNGVKDFYLAFDQLRNSSFSTVLENANKELQEMAKNGATSEEIQTRYNEAYKELIKLLEEAGVKGEVTKEILDGVFNIPGVEEATNALNNLVKSQEEVLKAFSGASDDISDYNQILHDLAEGKKLTTKETMDYVRNHPQLLKALKNENGQMVFNKQAVEAIRTARIDELKTSVGAQNGITEAQSKALVARLKNYGIEIQAIKSISDLYRQYQSAVQQNTREEGSWSGNAYAKNWVKKQFQPLLDVADAQADIQKLMGMVSSPNYGVNIPGGGGGKKSGKGTTMENQIEKYISLTKQAQNEYFELYNLATKKIELGIIPKKDILEQRFKDYESYVNKLFDLTSNLNQKIADIEAKRNDYKKGSKEWNNATQLIAKYKADLKELPALQKASVKTLERINAQLKYQNAMLEDANKLAESWKSNISEVVGKIKEIGTSFKDTMKDIGTSNKLNKQFNTNLFGSVEELMSQTLEAYKTEIYEYSKNFDLIYNTRNDKLKRLNDLSLKLAKGTATESDKILLQSLKESEDISLALKEMGLTVEDVIRKNEEFVRVIKQYEAFKKASERVSELTDKIKSFAEEFKGIQLDKEFELQFTNQYKEFIDVLKDTPTEPVDILQKQLDDTKDKFSQLLEESKKLEQMKFDVSDVSLDEFKTKAKEMVQEGFGEGEITSFFDQYADIWSGNTLNFTQFQEAVKKFKDELSKNETLKPYYNLFSDKLAELEQVKIEWTKATTKAEKSALEQRANTLRSEITSLVQDVSLIDNEAFNEAIENANSFEEVMAAINEQLALNNVELSDTADAIKQMEEELKKANKELEVTNKLRDVFRNVFSFDNLFVEAKDEFGNVIRTMNNEVVKTLENSSNLVDEVFSQLKDRLSDTMLEMLTNQDGFIDQLISGTGISEAFVDTFSQLEEGFQNTLSNLGSQASTYFSSAFQQDILEGMGSLDNVLGQLLNASLNAIPTVISDVLTTLPNMFLQLTNSMSTGVINSLTTILNQAITTISSALRVDLPLLELMSPTVNKIENTETQVFNAAQSSQIVYNYSISGILLYREGALKELAFAIADVIEERNANAW